MTERVTAVGAKVRALSERLVEAQRPLRILQAIRWPDAVEQEFYAAGCARLPAVDRSTYDQDLGFDFESKSAELWGILRDARRELGELSPISLMIQRRCREYSRVVDLLAARGTEEFSRISQELYGSSQDAFYPGAPKLADLGGLLGATLDRISASGEIPAEDRVHDSEAAVEHLQRRLADVFGTADAEVHVRLSDGIVADAAAGADYLKLRTDARFSERELRLLEVHEGWVHLGTNLNGRRQPYCTFLAKGPPSSTVTQEGLAVFMEMLTMTSHPSRLRRIANRVRGVGMAEQGADFLEVFRFFREEGAAREEAFAHATRAFRGSLPTAGPFTKDLSYARGFVLVYNYIQMVVERGLLHRIPLLFCGKTSLNNVRALDELVQQGMIEAPRFLPPPIADPHALAAWMSYSSFLLRFDFAALRHDYANLL